MKWSGSLPRVSTAGCSPPTYLALLLARLGPGHILNVGSGAGFQPQVEGQFLVNVDHVMPDLGASAQAGPGRTSTVVADAHALPFQAGSFRGALLKDVIEHLHSPIAALAETARVCGTGARMVVLTPRAIPRAVWSDPTHIRGFTAGALTMALRHGGWEPCGQPRRMGGFPGAGRLRLEPRLETIMRIPLFGHWFGTNWLAEAVR